MYPSPPVTKTFYRLSAANFSQLGPGKTDFELGLCGHDVNLE